MPSDTPSPAPPAAQGRTARWLQAWLPRSLLGQALLLVAVSMLLSFGLSGAWMAGEQFRLASDNVRRQAGALARSIALSSEDYLVRQNLDLVEELVVRAARFDEILSVRVFDARGQTLTHVSSGTDGSPMVRFHAVDAVSALPERVEPFVRDEADGVVGRVVAWHPIVAGRLLGWVRLDYGLQALVSARARIWYTTLLSGLLSCLFCALLLSMLLRRPMQSLATASAFAHSLERHGGDQLPAVSAPSEIASLFAALNVAAERLRRQKELIDASLFHLMSQEADMTDTNNQLNTIFTLSPDGLASFGADGRIMLANEALSRMVGLGRDQLTGQPETVLDAHLRRVCIDPGGFAGLASLFGPADDRSPRACRLAIDATGQRVLELVGRIAASATVRKLLYVRDVTRDTEVEQMKTEFLSTAAHELRTPMASIFGFSELLMSREYAPERRRLMLGKVHRQCQAMMSILDELLDLARIESRAGKDFDLVSVDLRDVVDEVVRDYQQPAGRSAVEWLRPEAPAMLVRVDRKKMAQVMLNLLSNAYKYSPDGGPVGISLICAKDLPQGERFGILVTDRGLGMTPVQSARIFERFYRADTSGKIPGTGLGMSIVREIVELLHGEITVDSALGVGTTIRVWLPPLSSTAAAEPRPAAPVATLASPVYPD